MANLTPTHPNIFPNVYQLESTDDAQAGAGGIMNQQAQNLVDRTMFLYNWNEGANPLMDRSSISATLDLVDTQSGAYIYIGSTTPGGTVRSVDMPPCDNGSGVDQMARGVTFTFFNDTPDSFFRIFRGYPSTIDRFYIKDTYQNELMVRPYEVITVRRIYGVAAWYCVSRFDLNPVLQEGQLQFALFAFPPSRALLCNGAAVSRTTYDRLFARVGTTYGVGNGSTTFNLPNDGGGFVLNGTYQCRYYLYY